MTITEKNARKLARVLVSKRLVLVCGMGIDDVPDTAQLCEIVDELEGMIVNTSKADFKREANRFLTSTINADTIEELIL